MALRPGLFSLTGMLGLDRTSPGQSQPGSAGYTMRIILNEAIQAGSSGPYLLDVFNVGNHYLVVFVDVPRKTVQVVDSFPSKANFDSACQRAYSHYPEPWTIGFLPSPRSFFRSSPAHHARRGPKHGSRRRVAVHRGRVAAAAQWTRLWRVCARRGHASLVRHVTP